MTAWRLDIAKLARRVDDVRQAGTRSEISYRQIARDIGVSPDMFTRMNAGRGMDVDSFCSLLMRVDPEARLADYIVADTRPPRRSRPLADRFSR